VTYSYDSGANGQGRLTGVAFGGGVGGAYGDAYSYAYSYSQAGRVTNQVMNVLPNANAWNYFGFRGLTLTATYQWDTEGRMTSMQYPTVTVNTPSPYTIGGALTAGYSYDGNGRLSGMTMDNGYGPQPFASATYTPAGQLSTLSYGAGTETRNYNSLMQMTSQSVPAT